MRFKVRRLLGVSALALLFGLPLVGCSGQQQDEEGLEVEQGENQAAENQEGADNQAAENNQAANEEGADEAANEEATDEGSEVAEDGTENDLQEIIQEMNGQPQNAAAAPPADLAAPAPAPANTAAAPAPAPAQSGSALPFQPGGTPAGNGLPELGSKMAYVVEKGDTLGKISQKIYGTPGRWNELATLSGITTPSRIFPGDLVYYTLDEGAVPFAAAYESIQKSEETVQPGDTLATIAKRVYGTTTAWRAIWRHNDRIENPDLVPPGSSVVYMPQGASATAMLKAKVDTVKLAKLQKPHKSGKAVPHLTIKHNLKQQLKTNSTLLAKSQILNANVQIANVSIVPVLI